MDLTLGFAKNTFRKDTFPTSQIVFASYVVGVMLCVTTLGFAKILSEKILFRLLK